MRRILVPVDGSDSANQAARFAAGLARDSGATVTLLHAYDAPTAAQLGFHNLPKAQLESTLERVARGSFDAARLAMDENTVTIEEKMIIGHPAREILTYIDQQRPDLVVMGSRGLGPLRGQWLGSVSQHVLRLATVPVTIVREPSSE